ncbi:hypothetical protein K469DRAFT_747109 [Zopfia rhizophila CBS 207.26]|uniref:Stc1 domain-containing protein n=1 Tax=Zopfia rhizophila CBS 207.26 TaxID=1314779 RepID=A0A6A6EG23_9PEZI|nr:hypothetical protein K469DRAFT_747109 [Zopfia rhizophila CBS 207.26]
MPSKNKKKSYAYDAYASQRFKSIALPDKIKCNRCSKWRAQASFSTKQLMDAKYKIAEKGANAQYKINCRNCTGQQLVEIECIWCHETKGLEEFAKTQRTKPDNAKCMACMEVQLELEAVEAEKYEDPRDAYVPIDNSGRNYPEYWGQSSMTGSTAASVTNDHEDDDSSDYGGGVVLDTNMRELSLTTESLIRTDDDPYPQLGPEGLQAAGPVQLGGEGWTLAKAKSWHSKSATPTANTGYGPVSSGFNPNKYGNPSSYTASVSGTSKTFNSNSTEPSDTKPGKWAKIKAYKPEKAPEPVKEEDDDWKSDSSEDDSGGGSDDSDGEI